MNWQALNPLRWATAAKHGAGALWEKRPRLTKRRVAWGLAVSMLAGGGALYGYQKLGPGRRPAAPAKTAQDKPVQPIPDTANADPNSPNTPTLDPNAVAANPVDPNAVDPNTVDPNAVAPNNVDPNAADPNVVDPNTVDPNAVDPNMVDPNAVDPNTVGSNTVGPNAGDPNTSDPNAVNPNAVNPSGIDPNAVSSNPSDPNAGVSMAGEPNAADPNSVDPNGAAAVATGAAGGDGNAAGAVAGQPAVYAAGDGQAGDSDPAGSAAQPGQGGQAIAGDTITDPQANVDATGLGGAPAPMAGVPSTRSRNSLRSGLAEDDPQAGAPVTTTPPVPPTPADLMPVPRRPQPSPPEEHVRLPPEAAPNLSPEGVPGGNAIGNGMGGAIGSASGAIGSAAGAIGSAAGAAGAAASATGSGLPRFGGGSPSLMAPPPAPPYTPPTPTSPVAGSPVAGSPVAGSPVAGSPNATSPAAINPGSNSTGSINPGANSPSSRGLTSVPVSTPSTPSFAAPPDGPATPYGGGSGAADTEPGVLPDMGGLPIVASPMPGAKSLEGPQVPMLELQKLAPEEVKVGKPARFEIKVKNIGRVAAQHIVVIDQIPRGTKFLEAAPPCVRGVDGVLRWQVGALGPGQETTIVLQLLPEQEGEIGSVAQVIFHSQAAVRTVSTQPRVSIEHQVAERVLIGDQVKLTLAVANRGSGATTNLVLEATLPESLGHPAGAELEYPIGILRPNETRRIELSLRAQRPGAAACQFVAREESQTLAEDRVTLDIQAPQLQVGVAGPKVRYLDRQATYSISVANPGTAAATNLEVIAYLPRGLKFLSAENQGQYDPQRHAVLWGLAELPSGVMGASQLVVVPAEPGEQRIRVEGKADLRLEHAFEQPVLVETLSEIQFSVVDTADPIEVGSETTYEIKLQNRGSRAASQVRVTVEFPAELTPTGGDGPTAVAIRGQQLLIDPLARLAPNAQATYRIRARGAAKGDPRIRVLVASDESPTAVTKEESTRVYSDE